MLGIETVRERTEEVRNSISKRHQYEKLDLVEEVLEKDKAWKSLKGELDDARRTRNELSQKINKAKKHGETALELIEQARELPPIIKQLEDQEELNRLRIEEILKTLPNILDETVPEGESEEDNVVRETQGEKPSFTFKPKSHVEIAEALGQADFDAARRTSGAGFFFLKHELALLEQALQRYALQIMVEEGFTPVIPPYMIRREIVDGVVDLGFFEEIIFKVEDEDLYPISTSEHSLIGMLSGSETDIRKLPILLCGISPCFRKELGAHGIDEKGLFRTHQFNKIEQVVVCSPEESEQWYTKLGNITKKIFTGLGLAWHELEMCAGDLGDLKARQMDLEVFSPRKDAYFEVASCSNLTDAQARRLNIRMMHPDGKREFAHTLNNTAIATSRAMVAIIENFQNEDGTVDIPKVLHPHMFGKTQLVKHE